jgi:hypothetical protein
MSFAALQAQVYTGMNMQGPTPRYDISRKRRL